MEGNKISLRSGSQFGALSAGNLKTASAISGTLQTVTDQAGNNSALQISSNAVRINTPAAGFINFAADSTLTDYLAVKFGAANKILSKDGGTLFFDVAQNLAFINGYSSVGGYNASGFYFGSGTITQNGALTIKGSGSNTLSVRNSSNVETNSISSGGIFFSNGIAWNTGGRILPNGDGIIVLYNSAATSFNRIQLGGQTSAEPAISKNGSGISITDATGAGNASLLAKDFTSSNLSSGTLATARPMRFGDRGTITEAGFVALGLDRQIAIEHNSVIYYIPVSQTIIP